MTVKEIAEQANVPRWKVYHIRKQIEKVPTVDEVLNYHWKKAGRPIKYELKECENDKPSV